ncbi:g3560 [Coccomyxa viridis]|uniref:G3560 protein n=1 Tax=Coccomyxa viridis TaxID=1274662 RepID=A0ABP1FN32_9CHLO
MCLVYTSTRRYRQIAALEPHVEPATEEAGLTGPKQGLAPARRRRTGLDHAMEGLSSGAREGAPSSSPATAQPPVVEARNLNNMHMSLLSAIWNSGDGGTTAAGEAAAATIDRVVNPPTAAMAAHEAANAMTGFVDMNKWADMSGFTDSDEEAGQLCSCGKVHPPTFNQPWHSVAAREEEAAAPAAAPAALADPGTEANLQDAAHLRVTALEKLPASSHGATEKPSQGAQTAVDALSRPGSDLVVERDTQPDASAVLAAEHVRSEDAK